ncbi:lipoprotein [Bordetella parapertussis]|uniref:Lipoprotein n=1 Tax=Bordetella parapertussis (strain Bpp5) TaxID=1208660 RepID=K0MLZ5_BORPB|nr:lipoprotein [Bordetella parapertussis]CCJ50868.1 putative lipoprotein [Bordetella parapertussis Bpp5]
MTRHFLAALLLAAASGAACAQAGADPAGQAIFDQIVLTSGAANGAARTCGASAPDLTQHAETWRLNLRRYADEYHYAFDSFDERYARGQQEGTEMMADMRASGVDGCTGALASFQRERTMTYDEMKQAIAEATDGLPEDQPAD